MSRLVSITEFGSRRGRRPYVRAGSRAATALACAVLALVATSVATAQDQSFDPPPGYYEDAEGQIGSALRAALHGIIDAHDRRTYDDVWSILENADAGAGNATVLTVYSNLDIPGIPHSGWTREHAWPKSYGFPVDSRCNSPYTDAHHLYPETTSYNSSRRNGLYDNCPNHLDTAVCALKRAGGFPDAVGNFRHIGSGEWEVWHDPGAAGGVMPVGRRGDVARAMFYMDVRYEAGPNLLPGCEGEVEPDLRLTADPSLVVTTTVSPAYMGNLETLLAWTSEDPVDEFERRRNQVIFGYQQNRNPFVDRPEWVATVWAPGQGGAPPTPTPRAAAMAYLPLAERGYWTYPNTATPAASPTHEPPTATHTSLPPPPTAIPPAQLVIGALQCETSNEYVRIHNLGGLAAQLSGWEIVSVVGPQLFTFPSYTLQPGESVFVHSGADAPPTGGNVIRWTGAYIWNNDGDTAELRDPAGGLVDEQDC